MDRLAREGDLFTRAYAQQAVCSASRAGLLTVMQPDTTTVEYPYNNVLINLLGPVRRMNSCAERRLLSKPHAAGQPGI